MWMGQCSLLAGWNSTVSADKLLINRMLCLPQIHQLLASSTVAAETAKRAQKIAEENRKQEICMTYNLVIAKIEL